MKKLLTTAIAATLCLSAVAYAQTPAAAKDSAAAKDTVAARAAADSAAVKPAKEKAPEVKKAPAKGSFGELDIMGGSTAVFPKESNPLKDNRGLLFNGSLFYTGWSEKDQVTIGVGGKNTTESNFVIGGGEDINGKSDEAQGITTTGLGGINYYTTRIKGVETTINANYKYTDTDTGTSSELTEYQEEEFMSSRSTTAGDKRSHSVIANAELKKEKGNVWFHIKPQVRYDRSLVSNTAESRTMSGNIVYEVDEQYNEWQQQMEEEMARWKEELDMMLREGQIDQRQYQEMLNEMSSEFNRDNEYERHTRRGWAYYSNNSLSNSTDLSDKYTADLSADLSFRNLGGKNGRTLTFGAKAGYNKLGGTLDESSQLWTNTDYEIRTMHYDATGSALKAGGSINYSEPLSSSWTLVALADVTWTRSENKRDASDASGHNDYFSSVSNANGINQQYDLTAQYKFGPKSLFSIGGRVSGVLNETYSKSKSIEDITGQGEWKWFVTPTARLQHAKGINSYSLTVSGSGQRPGTAQMLPVLNLLVPTRVGIGNVYLKPYGNTNWNANWTRKRTSTLSVSLQGGLDVNPVVLARWYDSDKVQYSIPVNSRKPAMTTALTVSFATPLDNANRLSLALNGSARYITSTGYQASSILPGVDRKAFDYTSFMDSFWGDASGSNFYNGKSGFLESNTRTFQPSANASLKYTRKHWDLMLGATTVGRISRYSLNPKINMNTLDTRVYVAGGFNTVHDFSVRTSFAYVFYNGYAEGFVKPEYQWNAEVSKKFGNILLSFKAFDILNQTRSLTHSVTANYEEDTYRLTMGRYFLLGLKWNFGKADASHAQRARRAAKAFGL